MSRHRPNHRVATALLTATLLLTMGGVSASATTSTGHVKTGGVMNVIVGPWSSLDPASPAGATASFPIFSAIYGSLFTIGEKGQIVPQLATGYHTGPGGQSLEIFLRHGVNFQDGTPFNAAAVKFNLERELIVGGCVCQPWLTSINSIGTPNKYTVVLHLTQKYPALIDVFASNYPGYIGSPTAIQNEGANFGLNPVGAGPFQLVSNQPNAKATVTRWKGYWNAPKPYMDGMVFTPSSDGNAEYNALLGQSAQVVTNLTTSSVVQQAKTGGTREIVLPSRMNYLELQTNVAPFNDIRAREAIFYATNPALLLQAVFAGAGSVAEILKAPTAIPSMNRTIPGFPKYNPTKAQALVQQLGGLNFTFSTAGIPQYIILAQALQQEWSAVGIHVTIATPSQLALTQNGITGNYQMAIGVSPASTVNLTYLQSYLTCPPTYIGTICPNPAVAKLFSKAEAAPTHEAEAAVLVKIYENIIVQNFAFLPLWSSDNGIAYLTNVHGLKKTLTPTWDTIWMS